MISVLFVSKKVRYFGRRPKELRKVLQKTARNTHISLNAIHSLIMAMIIKGFNHKEQPLVDELLAMGGN